MKKDRYFYIFYVLFLFTALLLTGCKNKKLRNQSLEKVEAGKKVSIPLIQSSLIEAYSLLNGEGTDELKTWQTSVTNWVYGSITSDNAYKGTGPSDQPRALDIETFRSDPENIYFLNRWRSLYKAIDVCNEVIRLCQRSKLSEDTKNKYIAEARFLRGHYHFTAKLIWNQVPFLDEHHPGKDLENEKDIWPAIRKDFEFAIAHLPVVQPAPGRVNKWAAKAYLAKLYMFTHDYHSAGPVLDDIIENGPFDLEPCYFDNFRKSTESMKESVFVVQYAIGDVKTREDGMASGADDATSKPTGPREYCKFHQPSQNLVNAFKTDARGLPMPDRYNLADVKNDEGIESSQPFTPYKGYLDPRIDWTVGRRGIPFLDYGIHPGMDWIWDQAFGGPYSMKKNILYREEKSASSMSTSWAQGSDSKNYRLIRFAAILLWRAEVAVEENDLEKARALVNRIRNRAKQGCVVRGADGKPAANYRVEPYPSFPDQDYARTAVRFETRLEFGMEGHRFFNLVRWHVADSVINSYLNKEQLKREYLRNVRFVAGKNEFFPIPAEILHLNKKMKQNPGY